MAYYAPFGNFQNEVVDPEELQREWQEAKRIAESMTHWQMCTQNTGNRFDFRAIKNSSSVIVLHKGKSGYAGHGYQRFTKVTSSGKKWQWHCDAEFLKATNHKKSNGAWLVPYMKGMQEVFDGDCAVTWKSEYAELVLFSVSWRTYRLSSEHWVNNPRPEMDYFPDKIRPRVKLAIELDGEHLSGTGPGMNVPVDRYDLLRGQGTFNKTEKSTSTFVMMVPAGEHRASPIAGQHSAQYQDRADVRKINEVEYFPGGVDVNSPEYGVSIPNCRLTVIRFPRGTMLGG
jgi:hypothetical protein|tara:strand:- start:4351 stop:5208 length:858 start_codon:yes stop_codon:yes gene_type:complete